MAEHTWDFEDGQTSHGPGCLVRHVSHFAVGNPCSHRGQAYAKADEREGGAGPQNRYSWPRGIPGPGKPDAWDFGKPANFRNRARKPWWHEGHHIVPHSQLRDAISDVGADSSKQGLITMRIQNGLRREGYNLNAKINMIILPVDARAHEVLGLPLHRKTAAHRNHTAYSRYVKAELDTRLEAMKPPAGNCDELPPYKKTRKKIEKLSERLYKKIIRSEVRSLDAMVVAKAPRPPAGSKAGGPP